MRYRFGYFKHKNEKDNFIEIEAENDREAVLKLYDMIGVCEFGCLKQNGDVFDDEDYKELKYIINMGC